jgi:hypothetical protein
MRETFQRQNPQYIYMGRNKARLNVVCFNITRDEMLYATICRAFKRPRRIVV